MLDTLERSHLSAQDELDLVAWENEVKASPVPLPMVEEQQKLDGLIDEWNLFYRQIIYSTW